MASVNGARAATRGLMTSARHISRRTVAKPVDTIIVLSSFVTGRAGLTVRRRSHQCPLRGMLSQRLHGRTCGAFGKPDIAAHTDPPFAGGSPCANFPTTHWRLG